MSKICFICAGLSGGGGMERSLTSLANYYSSIGHGVSIINLFKTNIYFELDPRIEVIWPTFKRKKYHRLIYAFINIPYVRKSIRSLKPDVLLSFGEWFNPYVIISTRFLKTPLYISDRMGPNLNLGFLLETARKYTYKYTTGIIAQTSIAAEIIHRKTNAENIQVIPNAVNVINTVTSIKKKQIVTVGRLSKEKGHIYLIRAFASLKETDWSLHIVGDGSERNKLENETDILNIRDRVFFYGHLKDFSQILGESEIFVLPSLYEGFPNALVEAMSVPLACISSNCVAGPGDIIQDNINGLLVPTADTEALSISIQNLITNKNIRDSISGNAYRIRETLDFDRIANEYLRFVLLPVQ